MGKSILTPRQSQVVGLAKQSDEITRWYYFTGGTALSECYLHHRLSEDLDFFTRGQVNKPKIDHFIDDIRPQIGYVDKKMLEISGLYVCTLFFADGTKLKIDFNEYDFAQVEQGVKWGGLWVDSLFDIAINKLYTILSRSRARDFVDLYFCLDAVGCDLDMIFSRIPDKFPVSYEEISIGDHLVAVADVTDYPTMLVPFDRQKMIDFYLAEAKKLEKKIFK